MIYLSNIASYLANNKINNLSRLEEFNLDKQFILEKIGVKDVSIKDSQQETSDLCVEAFEKLKIKEPSLTKNFDCLIVCTQNPDKNGIPHTSSILHGKLALNNDCACFDVSLGCSGYIYCLSIIKGFMETNNFTNGLLFTCDPYSKVVDASDKNTSLLFSDASTVTYLRSDRLSSKKKSEFELGNFLFSTKGCDGNALNNDSLKLHMDGRKIFNFAAKEVPNHVTKILKNSNRLIEEIDLFIFHQGSKAILNYLEKKLFIKKN